LLEKIIILSLLIKTAKVAW